ncbi:hypothetical protein LTR36_006392 [Oleoguttula mirabilis]|uniref:Uncharacterized protein n=1 Tax=Oleoguttula mirabilis TaxID=1507867 RepID=A0AAV9JWE5_9PEZI|nr:hypothetical protein LTR36_006392 [Oleoguttula mirabilis]
MGFFTDLLADVDKKEAAAAAAAPPLRPQKRKFSSSAAADAEERAAKAPKTAGLSQYFHEPYDIRHNPNLLRANTFDKTPPTYHDGPRDGAGLGPLIPCQTHAAMLRGKLDCVLAEKQRLESDFADGVAVREKARQQLTLHERGQKRFLAERGEGGMGVWLQGKAMIRTCLADAERRIERVRKEAKVRGLRALAEEEEE